MNTLYESLFTEIIENKLQFHKWTAIKTGTNET